MASSFFSGGMAEGMNAAAELGIKRDTLAADTGLRTRALDITEQGQKNAMQRDMLTRVDTQIDATMKIVSETISEAIKAGKDPVVIQKAIAPLVESAKSLAAKGGRDPGALDSQVIAQLVQPTTIEAKTMEGRGKAASAIAEEAALKEAGFDGLGKWKTLDEKVKAEGALRDDYFKASKDFITIRDAKNKLDNIETTGAGDMALVFTYMKILDPGSTVREGEYATAVNAAGVPSAIQALYNRAVGGGQLGDEARKQIKSQANKIYQTQAVQHDKTATQFANIARKNRLDPNSAVPDLLPAVTPGGIKFKVIQ